MPQHAIVIGLQRWLKRKRAPDRARGVCRHVPGRDADLPTLNCRQKALYRDIYFNALNKYPV
jgi:hypothetical protein